MPLSKPFVVLIGVAAAAPALAGPPDDPTAATPIAILRGSSAPPAPYATTPREVVREVVYPAYDYYLPAYYLALPFGIVRQHRHVATAAATMAHRK